LPEEKDKKPKKIIQQNFYFFDCFQVKHEGKLVDFHDFIKIIDYIEKKEEEKEISITPDMMEDMKEVFLVFDDQVNMLNIHRRVQIITYQGPP